jgi:hypothetical protein
MVRRNNLSTKSMAIFKHLQPKAGEHEKKQEEEEDEKKE